jgi:predicted RecA/RadA family phage recombinase
MNNYEQPGDVITFTAAANLAAGVVVRIGALLGVTTSAVLNGAVGEAKVTGVFNVPKVSGAVIAQGERLVWDASAAAFDDSLATPATGDVSGEAAVAWEAAGNGVTEISVKFTGVPGTVA